MVNGEFDNDDFPYEEDDEEEESEGMMLAFNPKTGELEEFKEEDYISIPKKDMDLIQSFIEANQEAFKAFCKEKGL